jgi:hypothetical protein
MVYRSSWKFWQALTPATIRRLLKPRHPFSGIALRYEDVYARGQGAKG